MGVNSGIYKFLEVLHILAAIVGFGSVILNGIHGAQAKKRKGSEGLAIMDSTLAVGGVSQKVVYSVFLLGILLVLVSDGTIEFGHLWISVSMGLYIVAVGISHGVLQKNVKRMRALMAELAAGGPPPAGAPAGPPPQALEMEQRGKTVVMASMLLDLILVAILALMVWKPL